MRQSSLVDATTPHLPARRHLFLRQPLGDDDLNDVGDGLLTIPVALELASKTHPADRLAARLDDTLEAGAMCLHRSAADRIDDRIDLVALSESIERREGHADLGP